MSYRVTLPKEFRYDHRVRAGVVVNKVHGYEGDLTKQQVAAIKADPLLSLVEIEEKPATPAKETKPEQKPVEEKPAEKK